MKETLVLLFTLLDTRLWNRVFIDDVTFFSCNSRFSRNFFFSWDYSIHLTFFFFLLRHKVTDFIEGGDLQQVWQETGSFHEDLIKIYVAEIALVLGI